MKIHRTVYTALTALKRNPMRALLTTLGIVIGVGAVIAMMEIGNGSSTAIRKTISTMGANVLLIGANRIIHCLCNLLMLTIILKYLLPN